MVLDAFRQAAREALDVEAVWAHGSLAMGDFRLGRSDFDLVAVVPTTLDPAQRVAVRRLHQEVISRYAVGRLVHCCYLARDHADDPAAGYPTWTQGELIDKPLTPVSRRELLQAGKVFEGPQPAEVIPPVTDDELATFIRDDLRNFWYPATAKRRLWLRTIWIDLGTITVARAAATLDDGRLITKSEALDRLPSMGAPQALVDDIRRRRYADPTFGWDRLNRANEARRFVRTTIPPLLT